MFEDLKRKDICEEHNLHLTKASCRYCLKEINGCKVMITRHSEHCRKLHTENVYVGLGKPIKLINREKQPLAKWLDRPQLAPLILSSILFPRKEKQTGIKPFEEVPIVSFRLPYIRKVAEELTASDKRILKAMSELGAVEDKLSEEAFDKHLAEVIKLGEKIVITGQDF